MLQDASDDRSMAHLCRPQSIGMADEGGQKVRLGVNVPDESSGFGIDCSPQRMSNNAKAALLITNSVLWLVVLPRNFDGSVSALIGRARAGTPIK